MASRALAEARLDADRMVLAVKTALDADADLLSPNERAQIDSLVVGLIDTRENGDAAAIESATQALAKGTEAFAAERMNRGIQQALAGKNIESV
jgi:molecular chaperone HscA